MGFEVVRSKKGIHLCQRKYALLGMMANKSYLSPLSKNTKLLFILNAPLHDVESYRYPLYLINTQPAISFVVHLLSRFVQSPIVNHHQTNQHVIRYIKFNPSQSLFFSSKTSVQLKDFNDFDWTSGSTTRRSTTGYYIFLWNSLIYWKSKKQSTVWRSST